jgi:lysozyme
MASRLTKSAAVLAAAVALVGAWEGLRTVAYRDPIGIPTVCFGETRGVKMGDRYTVDECKTMLGEGLADFEQGMRRCLKAPDRIPDKSYVAFLSLAYNIGQHGFCKSSIARYANRYADSHNLGDLATACNRILLYNKAGGRVLKGLVNRRKDEQRLCLEGVREKTVTGVE